MLDEGFAPAAYDDCERKTGHLQCHHRDRRSDKYNNSCHRVAITIGAACPSAGLRTAAPWQLCEPHAPCTALNLLSRAV